MEIFFSGEGKQKKKNSPLWYCWMVNTYIQMADVTAINSDGSYSWSWWIRKGLILSFSAENILYFRGEKVLGPD